MRDGAIPFQITVSSDKEKAKRNTPYLTKLENGFEEIKQGKGIMMSIEDLEAMETMTPEEAANKVRELKLSQEIML